MWKGSFKDSLSFKATAATHPRSAAEFRSQLIPCGTTIPWRMVRNQLTPPLLFPHVYLPCEHPGKWKSHCMLNNNRVLTTQWPISEDLMKNVNRSWMNCSAGLLWFFSPSPLQEELNFLLNIFDATIMKRWSWGEASYPLLFSPTPPQKNLTHSLSCCSTPRVTCLCQSKF